MKRSPVYLLVYIAIVVCLYTLFSSCNSLQNDSESNTSIPSIVPLTTVAVTSLMTQSTDLATSEPIVTIIPSKSTIVLSKEEKQALILKLLNDNAGCKLPCWWGITPGISTWNNTRELLENQGFVIGKPINTDNFNVYGIVGGIGLEGVSIYDGFGESNDTLEVISIQAGGGNAENFQQAFKNYSVKHILDTLGIPSRLWLEGHEGDVFGFRLWIFYDEQGILLRYSGITKAGSIYYICPTLDDGNITMLEIHLKGLKYKSSLEAIAGYEEYQREFIHSLDELGISTVEFYDLFSGNPIDACFDVPGNVFSR